MKNHLLLPTVACALAFTATVRAEEGGSAHYMPGTSASVVDAFPGQPGSLAILNYVTYYNASVGTSRTLPLGGNITAGLNATCYADTLVGLYQTPWNLLGGGPAFGVAIPYVWLDVKGEVQRINPDGTLGAPIRTKQSTEGIGDITLIPFMLGWTNLLPDFKLDTRLSVFAPTGGYEEGRIANTGKNYWTFEPGIMASYLSTKIGLEASLYAGVDFNTKNDATDYQSGTALHLDATLAEHVPLFGGFVGVGANAFYYQQISGDSGSGARLGGFEGMTAGVGPVVSYVRPLGAKTQILAEVKWLPELDVTKRLEGDYVWVKLGVLF